MKNTKTKMQESKQMIASKNVSCNSNDFVGKDSTNLNQASGNNQSKINNHKTPAKDKGVERDTAVKAKSLLQPTNIITYCNKHPLNTLSESDNPLSKKLFSYSTKLLLIAQNKNSDLYAMKKDLEIITNSFPDILYGSGRANDLNDHDKFPNIPEEPAKFLALGIAAYYSRVFSLPVFTKHYLKSCSIEDRKEFIEINKQLNLAPTMQNIDFSSLSDIKEKEELNKTIEVLYEKILAEVFSINTKHEQTLSLLENFFNNELSKDEWQKTYDEKVMEYENNINTIKSELDKKTQELQNAHEYTEKVITQITIEFEKKLEESKQNYEITISKQKKENKILKEAVEVNKENYDKIKLELELADKAVEAKSEELISKTKELDFIKISRDELKQKLAIYESDNKIESKAIINVDLLTEVKLADSDDESEEGELSLSKTSDKKMDKDEDVDDFFSPEANKKELEIISTPNYTDNVNGALDNNDHVSCNGEDSFHSDTD